MFSNIASSKFGDKQLQFINNKEWVFKNCYNTCLPSCEFGYVGLPVSKQ